MQRNERSSLPSRIFSEGGDVFLNYFNRKTVLTLATSITEDIMKSRGYDSNEIAFARDAVYLAIITMQNSVNTSGSAFCVTTLLNCLACTEDHAYWAGFAVGIAVSLAMDLTPWGVLNTAISTIGGISGKKCTLWVYENFKNTAQIIFHPTLRL